MFKILYLFMNLGFYPEILQYCNQNIINNSFRITGFIAKIFAASCL